MGGRVGHGAGDGGRVRDVERYVAEKLGEDEPEAEILPGPGSQSSSGRGKGRTRSDQIASLEQEFRLALGVKVEIKANSRGRGELVIHFADHDEFDRLREQLTDAFQRSPQRKLG